MIQGIAHREMPSRIEISAKEIHSIVTDIGSRLENPGNTSIEDVIEKSVKEAVPDFEKNEGTTGTSKLLTTFLSYFGVLKIGYLDVSNKNPISIDCHTGLTTTKFNILVYVIFDYALAKARNKYSGNFNTFLEEKYKR